VLLVAAPRLFAAAPGPSRALRVRRRSAVERRLSIVLEFAPPLVLAALGDAHERAGVVTIGLEGMMRFGAFAAAVGASSRLALAGLACGALAGAAAAGVHAVLSLALRADQVVSGIALNLVALG